MRPDHPLLPNYKHVPIGYHGRASSPRRQRHAGPASARADAARGRRGARIRPTRRLDYELEVGVFIGPGNGLGEPVRLTPSRTICSACAWSTTGPRATCRRGSTSRSAVPGQELRHDGLAVGGDDGRARAVPRRSGGEARRRSDAAALPCRRRGPPARRLRRCGGRVHLQHEDACGRAAAASAEHEQSPGSLLDAGPAGDASRQQRCKPQARDLLASGTVSGALEGRPGVPARTDVARHRARRPAHGEARRFLEDGDEVIFRGRCRRPGAAAIGFGDCRGVVLPAA